MAKSVDKIVKGINKMIKQLEGHAVVCSEEMQEAHNRIAIAKNIQRLAELERDRANRIADKLSEIVK